jgi:PAS domain S-box-containing protein
MLGASDPESVIGRRNTDFYSANRAWDIEKEEEWVFKTGKPVADKVEPVRSADGATRWLSTTKAPVRSQHGDVMGLVCVARDVTARVLGQQRLAESERRFRSFYNHTPAMLQTIDARGRLIYVSDYWCEILGYTRQDVIGRYVVEFIATADRNTLEQRMLQQLTRDGSIANADCRLIAKDGRILDAVLSAVSERNEQMELVQALCVLTDVTEKKALEQQLIQSQKMEAIGQLTGGVAHDFNNLLTVIVGNLDVAADRSEGELKDLITTALHASEKGAALTHRLLAYARRQLLTPSLIDLDALISGLADLLSRTLGETVKIELSMAAGLWSIHADKEQVENALVNLVINARDAMPEGGTIAIAAENIPCRDEETSSDHILLSVTDTGIGMSTEIKARAAEPFFTTKEVGKGSGLGLSMIDGFMRQTGGHMEIETAPGRGTTMRLYFPRATLDQDDADASAELADCPRGAETILVVEDNLAVRLFVAGQLRALGYQVLEAADGRGALEILKSSIPIDLLFSDIVIPGAPDGHSLAAEAQRHRPALRVLLTSGQAGHWGDGRQSASVLTKPYRIKQLARRLREALEN